MESKSSIGKFGEEQAKAFLERNGFKILEKNFRTKFGEIDIIAIDEDTDEMVFIEVKARSSSEFGFPEEAVNYKKQQKIKRAALEYLAANKIYKDWRIDVVSIILNGKEVNDIKIIKNITQY